ncbi:hypothetical protein EI77_03183 [Prosthecobacter fusiformis]|uniref:DUF1559 domain-containing protein n=1 Tax=Prosthecobacter fusiformis TaxID=48464 RepID=A0A4R7RTC1_9BACT|nr:hypothetical protein [Prosthecobacter fusiformis]TDU68066.1 hypothetical protein EI77_03183 [Prosthecobacter fusiformis]
MSEDEPKKGWGCMQWGAVLGVIILLVGFFSSIGSSLVTRSRQMIGASNAGQIVGLLLTYASEYNGVFPDHGKDLTKLTSNDVFRVLFKEGLIQDETIFGCPLSGVLPDKNFGAAPDYAQALMPGENHWMFTAGLSATAPSHYPLVMEDAVTSTWPPQWSPSSKSFFSFAPPKNRPSGSAWKDGSILAAFNDGSVQPVKLTLKNGILSLPKSVLKPEGKTPLPELKILDVE